MNTREDRALRLVVLAFGVSALLIVLQTVIYQLLPWDSSLASKIAVVLRVAFWLGDIAILVSLVALARAEPLARGLSAVGAALATFSVFSDLLGLGASALGSEARVLQTMARASGGAEPAMAVATSLLATLAVAALAKPNDSKAKARAVTIAVSITVALALSFRLARVVDPGARSLPAAWTSWLVEVTRSALVAWLALSLVLAARRAVKPSGPAGGPYRAAGQGESPLPSKESLDLASAASFRVGAAWLTLYRTSFLLRVAAAVATTFVAVLAALLTHSNDGAVLLVGMPLAGVATALFLVVCLHRLRVLPRGTLTRGLITGAIVAMVIAALVDAGTLVLGLWALDESYRGRRALRVFGEASVAAWPLVGILGGVCLLFVASALGRLGESLQDEHVVRRARWVQGLAVGAGAASIGVPLAGVALAGTHDTASLEGGWAVLLLLGLGAVASMVALVVVHVLLVGKARASVLAAVAPADDVPHAG